MAFASFLGRTELFLLQLKKIRSLNSFFMFGLNLHPTGYTGDHNLKTRDEYFKNVKNKVY